MDFKGLTVQHFCVKFGDSSCSGYSKYRAKNRKIRQTNKRRWKRKPYPRVSAGNRWVRPVSVSSLSTYRSRPRCVTARHECAAGGSWRGNSAGGQSNGPPASRSVRGRLVVLVDRSFVGSFDGSIVVARRRRSDASVPGCRHPRAAEPLASPPMRHWGMCPPRLTTVFFQYTLTCTFGVRPPSDIITDRIKTFVQNISHTITNYIRYRSSLYSVGFLC